MPPSALAPARWKLRAVDEAAVAELARARDLPELVARLLVARGFAAPEAARRHLEPELGALHDPSLLPDMGPACERLARALRDRETILVHGDYDVDGVTGTALLVRLFEQLGGRVAWHVPNRFTDGYSFGAHSVERALEVGAKLVVSVDNGTSSRETIAELRERGIDTIVTDHHEPPQGELPPAVAIVNPKLASSAYPFRELCGGAVAFKLCWGLAQEVSGSKRARPELRDFLVEAMSLVAIATVCDVVPLVDENRVLARYGLRSLAASQHAGLAALLGVAGLSRQRLAAEDVGFQIGPRINASGRLGSARTAVELLLCRDGARASELAAELDRLNQERKRIERELLASALPAAERCADRDEHPVLLVAARGWHQGVIGIVAARLAQRFERPAIVIGLEGASGRGSARSVPGFDLLELLHAGAPHLVRYGGHAQAAGLEVEERALPALRAALLERARSLRRAQPAERSLLIDGALELGEMTPALMRQLERLEPFGERNEKPLLYSGDLRLAGPPRQVGREREHLALELRRGASVLRAMAFGLGARAGELAPGEPVHVVHTPRWNSFRGETKLELVAHDFRTGPSPLPSRA